MTNQENNFQPLTQDEPGGTDYTLSPQANSVWITVAPAEGGSEFEHPISVYVQRTDEGVTVDLFARSPKTEEPLATTYVFFSESYDACNSKAETEAKE